MRRPFSRAFGHRLFGRIFLHGLLLILAVTAAIVVAFRHVGEEPEMHNAIFRSATLIAEDLDNPDALRRRIDEIAYITGGSIAVYERGGRALAKGGKSPPAPLQEEEVEEVRRARMTSRPVFGFFAVALADRSGEPFRYALIDWPHGGAWRWLLVLGLIVLVIAGLSFPVARSIARPLERLTEAARRLRGGDLSARSGFKCRGEAGVLAEAFDDMAGELERRILSEQELLANVSHELRTPLARIRVVLDLCEEKDASLVDVRRHLAGLAADVTELDRLVDEVLTAARLDLTAKGRGRNGPLGQAAEPLDLAEIAASSAERFALVHPSRRLAVAVAGDLPRVVGAFALLRRAVDNLIDNAVKYSPEDAEIGLDVSREGEGVVVAVGDRGIGVAPEDLPFLFEPFFRGERSRSRGAGGIGLGLALVRRIAIAHGGSVSAEPRDGGGMRFRLFLPA